MSCKSVEVSAGAALHPFGSGVRDTRRCTFALVHVVALVLLASSGPAVAQQYLGVTRSDQAPPLAPAESYAGEADMWWTSAADLFQMTGSAGNAPGMNRLRSTDARLQDVSSRCYGWGGAHGTGTGQCINTDKDGDLWFEIFFCDQEVPAPQGSVFACEGTIIAVGGTGKYRNITGSGTYREYIQSITPDGMLVGYAPGHIDLTW